MTYDNPVKIYRIRGRGGTGNKILISDFDNFDDAVLLTTTMFLNTDTFIRYK